VDHLSGVYASTQITQTSYRKTSGTFALAHPDIIEFGPGIILSSSPERKKSQAQIE
jgi:hypothetical protein